MKGTLQVATHGLAFASFVGLSYLGLHVSQEKGNPFIDPDHKQNLKKKVEDFLRVAEKNEIVTSFKELEKRSTLGGGCEDPYATYFKELVIQ